MRAPSVRLGRIRRRICLYTPALVLGALLMLATFPAFNAGYLAGVLLLLTGAAGFVLETGNQK